MGCCVDLVVRWAVVGWLLLRQRKLFQGRKSKLKNANILAKAWNVWGHGMSPGRVHEVMGCRQEGALG